MVRMVAFVTLLGGGGLLFATLALQEGADAHPGASKGAKEAQPRVERPLSAQPAPRVVNAGLVPPRPAEEQAARPKAPVEPGPISATSARPSERNFLTRAGTSQGAQQSPSRQAPSDQGSGPLARGEEDRNAAPKSLVDRAPPLPASVDAKAGDPVAALRGSSGALASTGAGSVARAKTGDEAGGRLDLNTASSGDLDRLSGGGLIGKAIVRGRPYASSEDLLRKRIVSRATFDRIKGQIAVR